MGSSGNPPDVPQPLGEPIDVLEGRSLAELRVLIKSCAPHLLPSFVYSEAWWERHGALPEAHVSLRRQPGVF